MSPRRAGRANGQASTCNIKFGQPASVLSDVTGGAYWDDPTPAFCDDVAVDLAVDGRIERVGRALHHAERLAVARRFLARYRPPGEEVNLTELARLCGVTQNVAVALAAEVAATAALPNQPVT